MQSIFEAVTSVLTPHQINLIIRAALILVVGWFMARLVSSGLVRLFKKRTHAQGVMLIRTFSRYLIIGLAVVMAINELGFKIGVLLGAAGVLTVAIGFASQTSMSNLISGLFLLGERPFMVGNTIRVGETIGEVLSIDLLSVKLRTFDNLFVRMPNETLIKQEVINYSRFSIRRLDVPLKVAFTTNLSELRKTLLEVTERNPLCLTQPEPFFLVRGFGDYYIEVLLGMWTQQSQYLKLKNSIFEEIIAAFVAKGIEIPYPHRVMQQEGEV